MPFITIEAERVLEERTEFTAFGPVEQEHVVLENVTLTVLIYEGQPVKVFVRGAEKPLIEEFRLVTGWMAHDGLVSFSLLGDRNPWRLDGIVLKNYNADLSDEFFALPSDGQKEV